MFKSLKTRKERNRAEKNAISYIEKKYGFTPEVVSSTRYYDVNFNFDILITYTKNATDEYKVTMRHDGKDFKVFIPFAEISDKGRDDYQSEEIASALKEKVASFFGGKALAMDSMGHKNVFYGFCTGDYYDGTNLEHFYSENGEYYVYTVGCDLSDIDFSQMLKEMHASKIFVFDFKDKEDFEKRYAESPFDIIDAEKGSVSLDPELPYLDEYALMTVDGENVYEKLELKEFEEFLYYSPFTDNISVEKAEAVDLSNWNAYGSVSPLAGGYTVSADARVSIYVPKSIVNGETSKIGLFYTYIDKEGNRQYKESHDFSDKIDEYSLFHLYDYELNNLVFMIAVKR